VANGDIAYTMCDYNIRNSYDKNHPEIQMRKKTLSFFISNNIENYFLAFEKIFGVTKFENS